MMYLVRGERGVQREYVAISQQYAKVFRILHSVLLCPFMIGEWIIGQHSHPEPAKTLRRYAAGLCPCLQYRRLAVEVEADNSAERKVQLAYAIECAMDLAVQREQQRYGMFGNGVR